MRKLLALLVATGFALPTGAPASSVVRWTSLYDCSVLLNGTAYGRPDGWLGGFACVEKRAPDGPSLYVLSTIENGRGYGPPDAWLASYRAPSEWIGG